MPAFRLVRDFMVFSRGLGLARPSLVAVGVLPTSG